MAAKSKSTVEGHAFLSYVHEDSTQVELLQQALQDAGIRVWRDKSDLWPGEDWREKIREAITDNALAFVACFSRVGLGRDKSYQNAELNLAIEESCQRRPDVPWLIPVRLDDCEIPDRDLGGGRRLSSLHRVDVFGNNLDTGVARLVSAIQRILGPADAARHQDGNQERRWAGDSGLSTLIRDLLLDVSSMRNLYFIGPESGSTPTLQRLARCHHLEPGEELIAIWRLGRLWGSSDGLAFTTSKISIADDKGVTRIPYSRFGGLEFERGRIATMVGSAGAFSCWITINGEDLQWHSPTFTALRRDNECNQIAKILNEIKQFLVNQDGRTLG